MIRHNVFKKINLVFLLYCLVIIPFIRPNAVVGEGKPIAPAPAPVGEEISVPLFGKITLSTSSDGGQEGALPDKSLAGLSFTKGRVKKTSTGMTVNTLVTFAGVQMQAEYNSDKTVVVLDSAITLDFVLKAPDGKPLTLLGVTFEDARLKIEKSDSLQVQIVGKVKFLGLVFDAGFSVASDINALFFATLSPEIKEWRPFAGVGISQLESIVVSDLQAGVKAGADIKAVAGQVKTAVVSAVKGVDAATASKQEGGLFASLFITGSSTILNTKSQVFFDVGFQQPGGFGVTGIAQLPDGWKLSQSFPELFAAKNPVSDALDLLKIVKAEVVLSSRSGKVFYNGAQQTVNQGLTLSAGISLDEPYENDILKVINIILKNIAVGVTKGDSGGKAGIMLQGVIPPDIKNLRLQVGVTAGDIAFNVGPAKFYGGQFNFIVKGEPSLGFGGLFLLKPTEKDEELRFNLEFEFTPIKFGLAGSMAGVWKNPFGIPGFQFGNLGLRGTQTYTALAEAAAAAAATAGVGSLSVLIPADAGIAGEVTLGDGADAITAKTFMNLGKDIGSLAIIAEMTNPITLPRLIELLLKQMGAPITLLNVIPFNLRKVKIHFVPLGTSIGGLRAEAGVMFAACADIFGKQACMDVGLDLTRGAVVKGTIERFNIGALQVTGANGEGDPTIDAQLGLQKQVFKVSGQALLADVIKSNTDIFLSPAGLNFTLESSFGPADGKISTVVKGSTGSITEIAKAFEPGKVKLEIEFKNDLTNLLNKNIESFIVKQKETFEKDLNDTITQVARRATEQDLKRQTDAVEYAQSRRVMCKDNLVLCIEREAEVKKEEIKLGLLKIKYDLEKTPLGDFLRNAFEAFGLNRLLEQALQGVRDVGSGVFEAGRFTFNKIANVAVVKRVTWNGSLSDVANGILKGAEVEVEFSGKLVTQKIGDFDLKNPAASITVIAENLAGMAINGIKSALNIPVVVPAFKPVIMPELTGACSDLMYHDEWWLNPDGTIRRDPGYDIREPNKHERLARECAATKQACSTFKRLEELYGTGQWPIAAKFNLNRACQIEAGNPDVAFLDAVMTGNLAAAQNALNAGANKEAKDRYGSTALIIAADRNYMDIVRELLMRGVDRDVKNQYGKTAVDYAASHNYAPMVDLLKGAAPAAMTPMQLLFKAVGEGDLAGVQKVLNEGLDKETKDSYGNTALIVAADSNQVAIVKELLARGVDRNVKNKQGKTAKDYASQKGLTEIIGLLG